MAANFVAASTQRIVCTSPPFTAMPPTTFACWVFPRTTGTARTFFGIDGGGADDRYMSVGQSAANAWVCFHAHTSSSNAAAGTVTSSKWAFVIGRCISTTNRRIDVLQYDGSIAQAQNTTSRTAITATKFSIGSLDLSSNYDPFDGLIGEAWYTATDISGDGGALPEAIIRRLAYGGPFSIPHIAKDVIEYRSFWQSPDSRGDRTGHVYHRAARVNWTNTNGVTVGPHPPLPHWYRRPGGSSSIVPI